MKDSVRLGAAVVGGYLLGRTKKGKTAIGLALWLSGNRAGNSREVLARLATSPEVAKLAVQVRGPLLAAAQRAVAATIESRSTALADSLQQRTSQLLAVSGSRAGSDAVEVAQPEPPRQIKRSAKPARQSPAGRSSETREPGRRRTTRRGGEVA